MMKEDLHTEFKQSFNEETIISLAAGFFVSDKQLKYNG